LGLLTLAGLALRSSAGGETFLCALCATACLITGVAWLRRRPGDTPQRLRLGVSVAFTIWFYSAVRALVPAIGMPLQDSALLRIDELVLGRTPSVWLHSSSPRWLIEIFSAGYLTFEVYVVWSFVRAFRGPLERALEFHRLVVTIFAVGYAGYLLVPALGPRRAFPEMFDGGWAVGLSSQFNTWIIDRWSSLYDVFPSLHIAVTLALLQQDFRYARRFLPLVLPVGVITMMSTVWLGYHYAMDLIAGVLLFLLAYWSLGQRTARRQAARVIRPDCATAPVLKNRADSCPVV
ncbi:MAG: phosphatase PAP2 family protein, partial [Planctomycetes bacterium]|nr:phosphatase PAP2 family protein [Planctomycetota bacterium]